jgi:cupin fold WbuC family metalloprotein
MSDFRSEIIESHNYIQCAALNMNKGKTFKPHRHNQNNYDDEFKIAQESWVVMQGSVKCTFYDLDNVIIAEPTLLKGDASFTLYGGHTYTILEDNTIVYEFKTGPYFGQKKDKTFI